MTPDDISGGIVLVIILAIILLIFALVIDRRYRKRNK